MNFGPFLKKVVHQHLPSCLSWVHMYSIRLSEHYKVIHEPVLSLSVVSLTSTITSNTMWMCYWCYSIVLQVANISQVSLHPFLAMKTLQSIVIEYQLGISKRGKYFGYPLSLKNGNYSPGQPVYFTLSFGQEQKQNKKGKYRLV